MLNICTCIKSLFKLIPINSVLVSLYSVSSLIFLLFFKIFQYCVQHVAALPDVAVHILII